MAPLLKIAKQNNGLRLDAVLARTYPQYSRVFFQKFMRKGGVTLAGAVREPSYRVRIGETFQVASFESFTEAPSVAPGAAVIVTAIPKIIFEDNALLVIDKPAGLVVHPAPGHRVGTLMDWLKTHLGSKITKVFTDPERLGLVHRLDKDTSGVLLIAKSIIAQTAVSRQFHDRTVQKTYTAFIEGVPSSKTGVITAPVGRSRKVPTRMEVSPLGRASETSFEVKETLKEVSEVSLKPKTGRTHQIRVHLSAIGHPIVGDRTYGAKSVWLQTYGIQRPLLHAERLELLHPTSKKRVTFHAPWPQDFFDAQATFRSAFKLALVFLAVGVLNRPAVGADETTPSRPARASTAASTAAKSTVNSDIRKMKREIADIKENLTGLASLASVKDSIERIDAADRRMRDLEHVASELNGKAVISSTSVEEIKTQVMEISRRLKNQQESLEQLRDQLERVQRQLIKQQTEPSGQDAPRAGGGPP